MSCAQQTIKPNCCSNTSRRHIQTLAQPSAILDLRFHPYQETEKGILAVVSSTGTIAIFRLDPTSSEHAPLQHITTSRCDDIDEDTLFLQCNWHPTEKRLIGVTTSTTLAKVLELDESWAVRQTCDLDIHNSLEAWCIAFAPTADQDTDKGADKGEDPAISIYCGGDDAMLRYSSWSWENDGDVLTGRPSFSPVCLKGKHDAGVTAILPLSIFDDNRDRLVITGSYDDQIRLFSIGDLHTSFGMRRVQLLAQEDMGGGVWRLDLIDIASSGHESKIRLLASCMHAGARVVEFRKTKDRDWTIQVLARFEEHKSMNYGSDFMRQLDKDKVSSTLHCISTSFYDKLLCLWDLEDV